MRTAYSYITNRVLESQDGKKNGRIRVIVPKGSAMASVDYVCPACSHAESTKKPWVKPFSFKCGGCGSAVRVPNLQKEFKKEQKKARTQPNRI